MRKITYRKKRDPIYKFNMPEKIQVNRKGFIILPKQIDGMDTIRKDLFFERYEKAM